MRTKIVYTVVSSSDDLYLEQAYISMFSAKYYMPQSYIVLVVDKETEVTFMGVRKMETIYADKIVSVKLDSNFTAKQRSRILKTSVRKYVEGDFLFIDTDTIICKSLASIDDIQADLAACCDTHSSFKLNPYRDLCLKHGKLLKWPIEDEETYFNSGVLYVKDNSITHEFYELWNKNWFDGLKVGITMDQPAFAKTNYALGHVVKILDDVWNCELKHGIRYLKDAKIVHYLTTNKSVEDDQQVFLLNEKDVLMGIKESGIISPEIKETIDDPFKGLATVTHLFSGRDLLFFRTNTYLFIHKIYRTKYFSVIETCIKKAKTVKKWIKTRGGG